MVACVFFAAGTCLPSRCLAVDVSSGSTIPAFRRHVTVIFMILARQRTRAFSRDVSSVHTATAVNTQSGPVFLNGFILTLHKTYCSSIGDEVFMCLCVYFSSSSPLLPTVYYYLLKVAAFIPGSVATFTVFLRRNGVSELLF
jgi:hypothetical protein